MTSRIHLIDSSIWVRLFRGSTPAEMASRVDRLLAAREAATNGLIRLEVLSGAGDDRRLERYRLVLEALIQLPIEDPTWEQAATFGYSLRRLGVSPRVPDLIVTSSAVEHDATLVHADSDFDHIARHTPLVVESYAPPTL